MSFGIGRSNYAGSHVSYREGSWHVSRNRTDNAAPAGSSLLIRLQTLYDVTDCRVSVQVGHIGIAYRGT